MRSEKFWRAATVVIASLVDFLLAGIGRYSPVTDTGSIVHFSRVVHQRVRTSILRAPRDFRFVNYHAAPGGGDELVERILNPKQARPGSAAVENHIQPVAVAQVAAAAPFVPGKFDIADAGAALDLDRARHRTLA